MMDLLNGAAAVLCAAASLFALSRNELAWTLLLVSLSVANIIAVVVT